jgi:hypothetical protein
MIKSYCDVVEALLPPADRPNELKALLPPVGSPYSFDNLSEAETKALEEALGDGFGDRGTGIKPLPLPATIKSGLLEYSYFELGFEEWPDFLRPAIDATFWSTQRYLVPLNFDVGRLLLYFNNQWNRFSTHVASEKTKYAALDEIDPVNVALDRLFEKPWYELHARFFCHYHESLKNEAKTSASTKTASYISKVSGQLGRLVEQYYWKLRFEKAAVTGIGARKGASRGGETKARKHKSKQQEWQRLATDIFGGKPELSKVAAAEIIRKRTREARTAKHIARYISKPTSKK